MKKFFKNICIVALFVILIFCLSSCDNKNENTIDDSYLDGLEDGKKNIFVDLFKTSSYKEYLTYDEAWETDYFTLSFTDFEASDNLFLNCKLTLKEFSIDEGAENERIYLGIYSYANSGDWRKIVSDFDEYYMSAVLEDDYTFGTYTSRASFELYDGKAYVVTIIAIHGELYTAIYMLDAE